MHITIQHSYYMCNKLNVKHAGVQLINLLVCHQVASHHADLKEDRLCRTVQRVRRNVSKFHWKVQKLMFVYGFFLDGIWWSIVGPQGTSIQIQWQQEALPARRGSRGSDGPAERSPGEGRIGGKRRLTERETERLRRRRSTVWGQNTKSEQWISH